MKADARIYLRKRDKKAEPKFFHIKFLDLTFFFITLLRNYKVFINSLNIVDKFFQQPSDL